MNNPHFTVSLSPLSRKRHGMMLEFCSKRLLKCFSNNFTRNWIYSEFSIKFKNKYRYCSIQATNSFIKLSLSKSPSPAKFLDLSLSKSGWNYCAFARHYGKRNDQKPGLRFTVLGNAIRHSPHRGLVPHVVRKHIFQVAEGITKQQRGIHNQMKSYQNGSA